MKTVLVIFAFVAAIVACVGGIFGIHHSAFSTSFGVSASLVDEPGRARSPAAIRYESVAGVQEIGLRCPGRSLFRCRMHGEEVV